MIRKLQEIKLGQQIRDDGPKRHLAKSGTPTMGGILIIFAVVLSTLLWADLTNRYVWLVMIATVGFGAVGFADDYLKFVKVRSKGLSAAQKFALQIAVALVIGVMLYMLPSYTTKLSVPFFKNFTPDLGWFYIVFAILVIVGSSNAVNLTDGLDGLAIGPVMIASLAYTIVAYVTGSKVMAEYLLIPHIEGAGEIAIFTGAILGLEPRISVVQHLPGFGVHGGCRIAAAGSRARNGGSDQQARTIAASRGRCIRDRSGLRHFSGLIL